MLLQALRYESLVCSELNEPIAQDLAWSSAFIDPRTSHSVTCCAVLRKTFTSPSMYFSRQMAQSDVELLLRESSAPQLLSRWPLTFALNFRVSIFSRACMAILFIELWLRLCFSLILMRRMRHTRDTTTKNARKIPMSKYSVGCKKHDSGIKNKNNY